MDARVSSAGIHVDPYADRPLACVIDVSTAPAAPAEQFDFYRSWHAGVVDIQLLRAARPSFPARHKVWQLGDLTLAAVEVPGSGYDILWEHRKRPLLDHWILSVPLSQSAEGKVAAGKPRLKCLALPDAAVSSDSAFLTLFLPRTWPATRSSKVEASDAALAFLANYAVLLHRSLPDLREGDVPHIVAATSDLFTATLAPSPGRLAEAQGAMDAVGTARIAKIIMERLADPNLTPEKLCRAVGVSRSRLYRIFEPAGGISNYVRRKRLLKTRDALADSLDRRSISGIAEAWGFTDASAYSRMFKSEFGMSPKEARELGWQGVRHATWLNIDLPVANGSNSLSNVLINNSLGLSTAARR